jgi:ParB family chromosome partitioning protein
MTSIDKARKGGLGKGIESLFGGSATNGAPGHGGSPLMGGNNGVSGGNQVVGAIIELDPNAITTNPNQPRKHFNPQELEDLAASIRKDGVLQPVIVSRSGNQYILIAGERRLRASKLAGMTKIPVIVKEIHPEEYLRIALIENIQRSDLNVIEEAQAYDALIKEHGLTQEACALAVGKERPTVTNLLRLLSLPLEVQDDLINKKLTMGHARALIGLESKERILAARKLVLERELNVRQTEQLCKNFKKGEKTKENQEDTRKSNDLLHLAENLRAHLRTKVRLTGNGTRGTIVLSYFSANELERILGLVGSKLR